MARLFSLALIPVFLQACLAAPASPYQVVESCNSFALALYSKLKKVDGNVFFSPFSIFLSMCMLYEGAGGATAREFREVFKLPGDLREGVSSLTSNLSADLKIANAVWVQEGYPVLESYLEALRRYYGGEARSLNLAEDPEGSRRMVNGWIADKTKGKIADMLPLGSIGPWVKLLITNAIYFNSSWAVWFDEKLTRREPFWVKPGESVEVYMMVAQGCLKYADVGVAELLEVPYASDFYMLIVLPKGFNLEEVEELLPRRLNRWMSVTKYMEVVLYLPRFKALSSYELGRALMGMGLREAFKPTANFSKLTWRKGLRVDLILHKAYVEVNEKGTEAASSTAIISPPMSAPSPAWSEPVTFRVDRPFIFMIVHKPTGLIAFMGRVERPSGR